MRRPSGDQRGAITRGPPIDVSMIALDPSLSQTQSSLLPERLETLGGAYFDRGLVCCREDGNVWPPSAFTSAYRDLLRRRKIRDIRFHSLRHCQASQLLKEGVSPKVISERLGQSKVGFTLDTYAHLLAGMDEEAADLLDKVVRAAQIERNESLASIQ